MIMEDIVAEATRFTLECEDNRLPPELGGGRMYDAPIFAFGDARDAMFESMATDARAAYPAFCPPRHWLSTARSVGSFFLPLSEVVRASNRGGRCPSEAWLGARFEGQAFILDLCRRLQGMICAAGSACVVPALHPGYMSQSGGEDGVFTSNWSERHVAFVCGMGTFSLAAGLITEKGAAGRLGSFVTDMRLPVSKRPYESGGHRAYCLMCGKCAKNCPANAISLETGKNHAACSAFLNEVKKQKNQRYGCGKCQVSVPCEKVIPARI